MTYIEIVIRRGGRKRSMTRMKTTKKNYLENFFKKFFGWACAPASHPFASATGRRYIEKSNNQSISMTSDFTQVQTSFMA